MEELFTRELGSEWPEHLSDAQYWKAIREISDETFWQTRHQLKTSLFSFITDRARRKWQLASPESADGHERATLLFQDLDRLKLLLTDPLRPVQFIFSGKAHPADEGGKQMIRELWEYASDPAFAGRIAFVENYSMHVAKYLVRGCDVWMNYPKAPLEASGTSGMKAAINGVPNFSILDGWWIEGWNGKNGWGLEGVAIGSQEEQDHSDAQNMYDTLTKEIIPLYYDRKTDGIPHGWLKVVKESVATILPKFSTERMLKEYMKKLYIPASLGKR